MLISKDLYLGLFIILGSILIYIPGGVPFVDAIFFSAYVIIAGINFVHKYLGIVLAIRCVIGHDRRVADLGLLQWIFYTGRS